MKMYLRYLFRLKAEESLRRHGLCLLMVFSLFLTSYGGFAQVVLSLDHQVKAGMPASTPSGDYWTMQLDYSISSITGYANGVKIEVALPDYVDAASGLVGTTHAPISNFVFTNTPGAKKITITFVDPVPSGSNGVIEYRIRAQNGATPNGTIIEPCATMTDGSGATSGSKCDEMPITAVNKFCGTKLLYNIGAIGGEVTYRVYLSASRSHPQYGSIGSLNASNISITDYYPAGATLVSAKVFSASDVEIPTTITHGTNSVTTTIPDYIHSFTNGVNSSYFEVKVLYTEPPFNTTDPVTNKASITYTPLGQSPITIDENSGANGAFCTNDLIETHILPNEIVSAELKKLVSYDSTVYAGSNIAYAITFKNTGSVPLENVVITENIPDELTLVSNRIDATGLGHVTAVDYQTNLSTTWLPLSPGASPNTGGAKITKVRLTLTSPFNGGEVLAGVNVLTFVTDANISDTTDIENCLTWTSTTVGLVTDPVCNTTGTILPPATTAKAVYSSTHSPGCGTNFPIGTELTLAGTIRAEVGYADMENPVAAFFVPKGFEYIAGSELFNPMTSGVTGSPVFTIVPDFMQKDGIFYEMYKWTFPAGTTIPMNLQMGVSFKVKITNQVPSGIGQSLLFVADGSNVSVKNSTDINGYIYTDTNDWDGDGNTTEQFRVASTTYTSCPLIVAASASMESIKWVKGLLDEDYSRYPATGSTVPGGNADYKLIVANKGNVPMKDIKIIDILPYVGDRGVIDPQARLTEWRPNLAAPISAPAGITVSYSVEKNPCRDELRQPGDPVPFPAGCAAAGWSTTPPADITRVQSVKIDFGSTVLGVGDSLIFSWPMRAPVTAPTDGEIAWNSFGFVATRTDNNQPLIAAEPIKVGIQVITGLPAYYGDRVWYDDNRNGLQDAGEAGVDGVTVHLYSPAVAGVQNPAVDSLVNFTITGNGGLYKFSNLTPGEYYAVFFLPSGFSISPDNQGTNDAIDSDGVPGTLDGQTVTIVPITTLEDEEEDYTWDQGIYCLLTPTISPVQTVAVNGSVTLTATGGTSYLWTGPNGFTASTASITINPVTPADTGTYTVTVMDGECRASLSTGIEIEDCPVIAAPQTTSQAVCAGESVVLSGTCVSPATIKWYSDEALITELSSTTVNPTVTTTYYAVCVDGECQSEPTSTVVSILTVGCACDISATVEAACHDNGTLEDTSDDYMTFLLTPSGGKGGGRFTLTASQGGSPIAVTLLDGTAFTQLSYAYPTPFRTPMGSAGGGNIILTLTDSLDLGCTTTVTITDTGVCGTDECVGDTPRTVAYSYRIPFSTTELINVPLILPKFNDESGTRQLTKVNVSYGVEEANTIIFENTADRNQTFQYSYIMKAKINLNSVGIDSANATYDSQFINLASAIDIGPQGSYAGDSTHNGRLSTVLGMSEWLFPLTDDIYVDPRLDPRWVTNATGNQSYDDDIFVSGPTSISAIGNFEYTDSEDLAGFVGLGEVPLSVITKNTHSTLGGGGNHVTRMRTKAFAYATVTYTYVCNTCETPDAGADIALNCEEELPESVTLVGAPTGGVWSVDPANPSAATVSGAGVASGFTAVGTYRFIYSVSQGGEVCSDTVQVSISLKPSAPVLTPVELCYGEMVTLEGNCASGDIKWYADALLAEELTSTTFAGIESKTYYAVCSNEECSSTSSSVEVSVKELPTISVSGSAVCNGAGTSYSVTVTATAGATITSSAGTVTGNTISGIPSGVSAIITAELEGCRDSVTVMQNCTIPCVAPNPTVRGAATICEGESTELTAEGCTTGFTYLWSTEAVTQSITVEPVSTTTYTVRCVSTTEATCISVTPGSAEVTVTPKVAAPTGVTATPSEIYTGESSVLTATCAAGLTPSWFTDEALTTPLVSTTVSPVTTSTYYVICGEDKDCAEIAEVTVTVSDAPCVAPNPTVRGAATICEGESTELTAEGCTTGFTYLWSTGAVTQSITVEPASTATYTVRCVSTTEATCISVTPGSAEVTVTPKVAAPTVVTATPSEIYTGESSVLTATCAAGLTPSWFTDEALTTPLASTTVSPLTTTTYYVICGEAKDCAEVAEITVTVSDEPLVFDVALRKRLGTGQSRTVQPGDEVTFTITVFNQGNVAAQNIQVTDYIPEGLTLVAGTVWTAASGKATLNTPIASLGGGDSTKVNITFTVNAGVTGPVINLAEISSVENEESLEDIDSTPDDDKNNDREPKDDVINEDGKNKDGEDEDDHDPETITVTPTPIFDLALRKTMAPGSKTIYKVGDVVTFNITVFNQGTVAATSVDLVDYIPAGLTLQDNNWTLDGDKARWNGAITNLAPETQRTVTISFVVNSDASGIVINTAEISGSENEEGLEDKDSTPDDNKDNDGPVKNDEIDEDGKDGRDEDDHDIEPITICPDAKCLNVKTVRNK